MVWSYLLLAVGLLFYDAFKRFLLRQASRARADGYDRHSEGAVRITSNTLSPKGKEDFMEAVLNTEDIRKQRFTFASSKRKTQTATEAEAQQSGIGDFPHSTLGKRSLQIGIIFLKPHGIALSLHREQETNV